MSARVSLRLDDGGEDAHNPTRRGAASAVAVKVATTPEDAARLAAEAQVLEQLGHPGVVGFVAHRITATGSELLTRYAGPPLTHWRGSTDEVAGLVAAVATTVSDLHDHGITHGRIDRSHVLLAEDGRPVLCGLAPPPDAQPSDDIHALGTLLGELLDQPPPDTGTAAMWRRRLEPAAPRRRLGLVATRATVAEPDRRPTARAFGQSLLDSAPGACLPTPPEPPDLAAPSERSQPAELPSSPSEQPPEPASADLGAAPPTERRTEPRTQSGDAAAAERGKPSSLSERRAAAELFAVFGDHHLTDAQEIFEDRPWTGSAPDEQPAYRAEDIPRRPATKRPSAQRPSPATPTAHEKKSRGSDDPGDRLRRARRQRLAGAAAAVALLLLGLGVAARASFDSSGPGTSSPAEASAASDRAADAVPAEVADAGHTDTVPAGSGADEVVEAAAGEANCAERPEDDAVEPDGEVVARYHVDITGDGCPQPVLVTTAGVVHAGNERWAVGEPGDAVTFGDWHCTGQATAAVLRPETGDVFIFSGWADDGAPLQVDPVARVPDAHSFAEPQPNPGPDGTTCDQPVVELTAGEHVSVEVP